MFDGTTVRVFFTVAMAAVGAMAVIPAPPPTTHLHDEVCLTKIGEVTRAVGSFSLVDEYIHEEEGYEKFYLFYCLQTGETFTIKELYAPRIKSPEDRLVRLQRRQS